MEVHLSNTLCSPLLLFLSDAWYNSISGAELGIASLFALFLTVFFSVAEGALLSNPIAKLEERFGEARRPLLEMYLKQWDSMLVAVLVCDVVSNILFVSLGTMTVTDFFGVPGRLGALLVFTVCILIVIPFGEILPRSIGSRRPAGFLYNTLPLLHLLASAIAPLVRALDRLTNLIDRSFKTDSKQDIEDVIYDIATRGERQGKLAETEREMIESIFDIKDTVVTEIMTPRTDMVCIADDAPLKNAVDLVVKEQHSRIPVFRENRDKIVGVLYAKDLFNHWNGDGNVTIASVMRQPMFIPESKKVGTLLKDMRANQVQLAIILDEYGGTTGLVTIEDILEEIVGDISDEYDVAEAPVQRLDANTADVTADLPVDEANSELEIDLPESSLYDTVGGYIFNELGHIPRKGEEFSASNVHVTILDADERKIRRVRLRRQAPQHTRGTNP